MVQAGGGSDVVNNEEESGVTCEHCGSAFIEFVNKDNQQDLTQQQQQQPASNAREEQRNPDPFGQQSSSFQQNPRGQFVFTQHSSMPGGFPDVMFNQMFGSDFPFGQQQNSPFAGMQQQQQRPRQQGDIFQHLLGNSFQNFMGDEDTFATNFNQNFRSGGGGRQGPHGFHNQHGQNLMENLLQRMAQESFENAEEAQKNPADKETVAQLPIIEIEKKHCKANEKGEMEKPTCNICLTEYQLGDKAIFLPCGHIFHPDCIKPWFSEHNSCPVCRKELPAQK